MVTLTSETETTQTYRMFLDPGEQSIECEADRRRAGAAPIRLAVRGVIITRHVKQFSTTIRTTFVLAVDYSDPTLRFEWEVDRYHSMPTGLPEEWAHFIDLHITPFTYMDGALT